MRFAYELVFCSFYIHNCVCACVCVYMRVDSCFFFLWHCSDSWMADLLVESAASDVARSFCGSHCCSCSCSYIDITIWIHSYVSVSVCVCVCWAFVWQTRRDEMRRVASRPRATQPHSCRWVLMMVVAAIFALCCFSQLFFFLPLFSCVWRLKASVRSCLAAL